MSRSSRRWSVRIITCSRWPSGSVLPRPDRRDPLPDRIGVAPSVGDRRDPELDQFGWFARAGFRRIDWIPARLTAVSFAIVGDFEDAVYCWRTQAAQWDCGRRRAYRSGCAGGDWRRHRPASCSRPARARSGCGWAIRCDAKTAARGTPGTGLGDEPDCPPRQHGRADLARPGTLARDAADRDIVRSVRVARSGARRLRRRCWPRFARAVHSAADGWRAPTTARRGPRTPGSL